MRITIPLYPINYRLSTIHFTRLVNTIPYLSCFLSLCVQFLPEGPRLWLNLMSFYSTLLFYTHTHARTLQTYDNSVIRSLFHHYTVIRPDIQLAISRCRLTGHTRTAYINFKITLFSIIHSFYFKTSFLSI